MRPRSVAGRLLWRGQQRCQRYDGALHGFIDGHLDWLAVEQHRQAGAGSVAQAYPCRLVIGLDEQPQSVVPQPDPNLGDAVGQPWRERYDTAAFAQPAETLDDRRPRA